MTTGDATTGTVQEGQLVPAPGVTQAPRPDCPGSTDDGYADDLRAIETLRDTLTGGVNNPRFLVGWYEDKPLCHPNAHWRHITCDSSGRVSYVNMPAPKDRDTPLAGTIPPEVCLLSRLRTFRVTGHQLTGNIPDTLGSMPKLLEFQVSGNRLSGTIPSSLAQSPTLRSVSLHGNDLEGPIPPEVLQYREANDIPKGSFRTGVEPLP